MVVVICAICGEPGEAENEFCPSCEATEVRAVPEEELPSTPAERLIANAHRTVDQIGELHKARARQLDEAAKARLARALRARAEGQVGVIEARLRHDQEARDTAAYHEALERLKRELLENL